MSNSLVISRFAMTVNPARNQGTIELLGSLPIFLSNPSPFELSISHPLEPDGLSVTPEDLVFITIVIPHPQPRKVCAAQPKRTKELPFVDEFEVGSLNDRLLSSSLLDDDKFLIPFVKPDSRSYSLACPERSQTLVILFDVEILGKHHSVGTIQFSDDLKLMFLVVKPKPGKIDLARPEHRQTFSVAIDVDELGVDPRVRSFDLSYDLELLAFLNKPQSWDSGLARAKDRDSFSLSVHENEIVGFDDVGRWGLESRSTSHTHDDQNDQADDNKTIPTDLPFETI